MCSSFQTKVTSADFDNQLGREMVSQINMDLSPFEQGKRVFPHTKAPVLRLKEGCLVLEALQFSLLPSWAKEKRIKFSTHNARLESIYQKPTWREAFQKRHCIIPMTDFFEPIRTGEYANQMVRFFPKDFKIIWAVGIWEQWVSKQDGEIIESFAILTDDPVPFVKKIGHDRSPVFLQSEKIIEWLSNEDLPPEKMIQFLRSNKAIPPFEVERDRPMKEKKVGS